MAPELLMVVNCGTNQTCSYATDAYSLGIVISFTSNGGKHPLGQNKFKRDYLMSEGTAPTKLGDVAARHQKVYFPEDMTTRPWQQVGQVKRYRLSFPFYPFRTLCPRELVQSKMLPSPFDASSPLFPAHTQLNITMKRRPGRDFLNFMLPDNLNVLAGTTVGNLTDVQRATATQFRVTTPAVDEDTPAVHVDYRIKSVSVTLVDAYLQVLRIKYKGVSPERPLSNVYTSYRSTFTPLLKVSLHQYPLSWESSKCESRKYSGYLAGLS